MTDWLDPRDLRACAADAAESIAEHFLGHRNHRLSNKAQARWGKHGRVRLHLTGPYKGHWQDFAEGNKLGDVADLVCREMNCDQKAAYKWLVAWFGGSVAPVDHAERERKRRRDEYEAALDRELRFGSARQIWQECLPLVGSPAEKYLVGRLGLPIPTSVVLTGQLAFHPAPHCSGIHEHPVPHEAGALIARMIDPATGKAVGIHRTFLDQDGGKIRRKMLGGSGVVMLTDPEAEGEPLTGLGLAEGLEDGLGLIAHYGWQPMWAALNSGNMRTFPVLADRPDCSLTLFPDRDSLKRGHCAGQEAATECAERWIDAGREVTICETPGAVKDFADLATRCRT